MENQSNIKLGQGWISGYISAALGILSLFGVFCFYFPQLLTSEEFRKTYSIDFARWTMFISLIISYFMGMISFCLNQSKRLSLIGIVTSLLATILGGSRIEVQHFESTPYSFGLDWFALSFLFSMLIFIPIERSFALHKNQRILRPEWRTDLTYFFISHLFIQFIFLFTNSVSTQLFGWTQGSGLTIWIQTLPIWVQFLAVTFLADLFQYMAHRTFHLVPSLWRFHSIHHSSEHMDWLAGSRTHFLEVLIVRSIVLIPLYVLGFSQGALNAYVVLVGVQAVMIHANMGIDFGFLRYIIATPQFHHWHHSKDRQYMDANYAVHLPIIDILFGTYRCPKGEWPKENGIVSGQPPKGFLKQLVHPFKKSTNK